MMARIRRTVGAVWSVTMRTRCFVFLVFGFLLLSDQALGQPPIYVSRFGAGQILSVDGTTGLGTTVLVTLSAGSRPEDLVVGPDGKIYVCDSFGGRILRMDANGTPTEILASLETVFDGGAVIDPEGPEGPAFFGTDLYFNTRGGAVTHSGVWKIEGVGGIPFGVFIPPPINVITALPAGTDSTFGEGLAFTPFDESGDPLPPGTLDLLIVDRSNDRILRASPPSFRPITVEITGLDVPIGIAVDLATGDIFVGDRGTSRSVKRFDAASPHGLLATFTDVPNVLNPFFLEFDHVSGDLFVASSTFAPADPTFGPRKVFRLSTSGGGMVAVPPSPFDVSGTAVGNIIVGLAVGETSITPFPVPFTPGPNRTGDFPFLINGDESDIELTFDQVIGAGFDLSISAIQKSADDPVLAARTANFGPCIPHDESGDCFIYRVEEPIPIPGTDFRDFVTMVHEFNGGGENPRLLQDEASDVPDKGFADITIGPGSIRGRFIRFSEFVVVDGAESCGLEPPVDGAVFKAGRTIPFKFRASINCSNPRGPFIDDLIPRLLIDDEPVEPDLFRRAGHKWILNFSTKGLPLGDHTATISDESNQIAGFEVTFSLR